MKTRINSVLILAATLSVSALIPLSAASNNSSPAAFPVKTLTASVHGGEQIERGTPRGFVAWAMRLKSHEELTPDVWVYTGYHADLDQANQQDCGTLVITFANDKVVDLQLVNKPAAAFIAANLKNSQAIKNVASAK